MDAKDFQLLNDLLEQRLDAERVAELGELLRNDPALAECYFAWLRIHQELIDKEAPVRPFSREELRAIQAVEQRFGDGSSVDTPNPSTVEPIANTPDQNAPPRLNAGRRRSSLRYMAFLLATAVTLLAVFALVSDWRHDDKRVASDSGVVPTVSSQTSGVVARVVKKIDCDWEEESWSVETSADIATGQQINLARGLLVIEFNSGAELTLNGPATLIATSDLSARLLEGQLSARVPPRGRGFRIETHAGDFVDLGTEFGMIVSAGGAVETHVFSGKVIAEPVLAGVGEMKNILLETGEAWAQSASGAVSDSIDAQPERFMRSAISREEAPLDPPPAGRGLALWFHAASRVQRDQRGNVSSWGDNLNSSNVKSEDAWQVAAEKRPIWVPDAIGGRPALRFDGFKSLVTEPIHLGADQTSAVVFRVDRDAARELVRQRSDYRELGVQLLNLNGPPHTVLQVNDDARLEARVHLGLLFQKPVPVDVGRLRSDLPVDGSAHVAVYSFDTQHSIARLYVDGNLISESLDAPDVGSTDSPRYLGSHYGRHGFGFTGDIAEILVYDAALTAQEAETMCVWLAQKYDIETPGPMPAEK